MKKIYEAAEIELIRLASADVLTTSDGIIEDDDEGIYSKPY